MFVYFLRHVSETRFKIGKANDLHRRVASLGGELNYLIAESYYLEFASEEIAYRVERVLHRTFEDWRLPVQQDNRYDGDTEQFDQECWPRLMRYLVENMDLFMGVKMQVFPKAPRMHMLSPEKPVRKSKAKVKEERIESARAQFTVALAEIKQGVCDLNSLSPATITGHQGEHYFELRIVTDCPLAWASAHQIARRWGDLTVSHANGNFGGGSIFPSSHHVVNQYVQINMSPMHWEVFDSYRVEIISTMSGLKFQTAGLPA